MFTYGQLLYYKSHFGCIHKKTIVKLRSWSKNCFRTQGKDQGLCIWGILQKLGHLKFCVWVFCLEMVKHPQTYPLIPKIPLGWSIKSKFWRIFKYTFIHVKYVVQRFVPRDLIFWSFAYCLTISESSCQHGSDGTQIWASNSMVSS